MGLTQMPTLTVQATGIGCHAGMFSGLKGYDSEGVSQPLIVMKEFCRQYYNPPFRFAFVLFGDNESYGHGKAFSKFITDNELGTVYATEPTWNPNYLGLPEHKSIVWIWTLNHDKLKEWYDNNQPKTATPTKNIYARIQPF